MEKTMVFYAVLVLFEVTLSLIGSLLPEPFYLIVYLLSFLIPVAIGVRRFKKERAVREAEAGVREETPNYFGIRRRNALFAIPIGIISVGLVFLVSYLTTLVLSFFNISGAPSYSGDFTTLLFRNALIPAFLEELLFRYLPILLLAHHGKRRAIVLSSVLFALAHASVYQMPYALIAGVIFITADLIFDSVIPSLAFHLLNNAVSVIWMFYINTDTRITVFVSVLSASVLVSLIVTAVFWREYKKLFSNCFKSAK